MTSTFDKPDDPVKPVIEAFDQSTFDSSTPVTFGGIIKGEGQTLTWKDCDYAGWKVEGKAAAWTEAPTDGKMRLERGFSALFVRQKGGELRESN